MLSLVVLGCLFATVANAQGPIVSVQQGKVEGFTSDNLSQFLGIPFAAPPLVYVSSILHRLTSFSVGHLRLNLPAQPLPFNGTCMHLIFLSHYSLTRIVQALAKGAPCPQQSNTSSAPFNNIIAANPETLGVLFASGPSSPQGQEDCVHFHFTPLRRLYIFFHRSYSRCPRSGWDYRFLKITCPLCMPPTFSSTCMTKL